MTEAPWSRAVMAAASPETPAPMMTTSADRSHLTCAFAACAPTPANATAPTPAAPFDRKALLLTDSGAPSPESRSVAFLPIFYPSRMLVSDVDNLDFVGGGVKTATMFGTP